MSEVREEGGVADGDGALLLRIRLESPSSCLAYACSRPLLWQLCMEATRNKRTGGAK
jgi:hypothetical protein